MGKFHQGLSDELSLYVRHLAWLNTVPDSPDDKTKVTKSRRELSLDNGVELEMPECDAFYLVGYLMEAGPTLMVAGMGESPLTHSELIAWQTNTGIELNAWEARTLRRLSGDYLGESQRAKANGAPAPWNPEANQIDRVTKAEATKNALRDLAKL